MQSLGAALFTLTHQLAAAQKFTETQFPFSFSTLQNQTPKNLQEHSQFFFRNDEHIRTKSNFKSWIIIKTIVTMIIFELNHNILFWLPQEQFGHIPTVEDPNRNQQWNKSRSSFILSLQYKQIEPSSNKEGRNKSLVRNRSKRGEKKTNPSSWSQEELSPNRIQRPIQTKAKVKKR
jgi:hypothetical protein